MGLEAFIFALFIGLDSRFHLGLGPGLIPLGLLLLSLLFMVLAQNSQGPGRTLLILLSLALYPLGLSFIFAFSWEGTWLRQILSAFILLYFFNLFYQMKEEYLSLAPKGVKKYGLVLVLSLYVALATQVLGLRSPLWVQGGFSLPLGELGGLLGPDLLLLFLAHLAFYLAFALFSPYLAGKIKS